MKKIYLLFLLMLLPLVASAASQVEIDGIWYYLDSKSDTKTASVASNLNGNYSGDIVIPESVTYEEVTYNVSSIANDAFYKCNGLTSVTIPNGVTSIGGSAFSGCNGLTSVTIPNSVTSIGIMAFNGCSSLTSVTIPNSVTSIGNDAFCNCTSLTSIKVEDGNPIFDSRDNCNAIVETATNTLVVGCKNSVIPNGVTSIGNVAFDRCSGLTSVTIPNSVTSIGISAFFDCSGLTSIIIPNSVASIGYVAFGYCSGLTSVTIPNSVTSIGEGAFYNCSGLTSLTIPSSVSSIGENSFGSCSGLTGVTSLATTPPQALDNSFSNYDIPLYVPKGTRDAYLAASPWNKFKEIVELGNTSDDTDVDEITIKDIGKTTWCSEYDLDFTNVAGIKAYTATGYNNITKTIWLTRVMEVPAGTGILVKGDAGTYKIPHAEVQSYYVNMLVGNLGETIKIEETDGDKTNYYLSGKDGTFVSVNGNANIGKNKAYLQLPTSIFAGTRTIGVSFDDEDGTTAIRETKHSKEDGAYYTLQGQRVAKPGKGLYIRNGKKVVIK